MENNLPMICEGLTARDRLFMAALFGESGTALKKPARITHSTWVGHIPFAFWLARACQPRIIVELGSYYGASFGAFCQQTQANDADCLCYAVDTWKGDTQSGYYGEEVYRDISTYMEANYPGRAFLIRSSFDDAVEIFDDGSIDILHIDGCHTREAILHDFRAWLPKLSDRAVVLMHDINARLPGFNGFEAWQQIAERFPHFAFNHSYGLGVALPGTNPPKPLRDLAGLGPDAQEAVRRYFSHAGDLCETIFRTELNFRRENERHAQELAAQRESLESQISGLNERHAQELAAQRESLENAHRALMDESSREAEKILEKQTRAHMEAQAAHRQKAAEELEREKMRAARELEAERQRADAAQKELEDEKRRLADEYALEIRKLSEAMAREGEKADAEARAMSETISLLESRLRGFENSNSWKVTAPLRKLRKFFSSSN